MSPQYFQIWCPPWPPVWFIAKVPTPAKGPSTCLQWKGIVCIKYLSASIISSLKKCYQAVMAKKTILLIFDLFFHWKHVLTKKRVLLIFNFGIFCCKHEFCPYFRPYFARIFAKNAPVFRPYFYKNEPVWRIRHTALVVLFPGEKWG